MRAKVEAELIFPLLRGRDVKRWSAIPSAHILLTQDPSKRAPIPEAKMRASYPHALSYLSGFKEKLKSRSGYKRYFANRNPPAPFYALYNVGPYTIAPWKVLWPEVANGIEAGVAGPEGSGGRSAIPDHTLIFVGCDSKEEAHFVCGVLNSIPCSLLVRGYIVLHPSPHVLENVAVPRYDADNKTHKAIANFSANAHLAHASSKMTQLANIEGQLNAAVATLFGIKEDQMKSCEHALHSLIGLGTTDSSDISDDA